MSDHDHECHCEDCRKWYEVMSAAKAYGRCGACNKPIDDHPKDKDGMMQACPAKARA